MQLGWKVLVVAVFSCFFAVAIIFESRAMSGGSIYRNTVWFIKGLREYTRSGYEKAERGFNQDDMKTNITGRAFMITGGNSGLGKETAIHLAKKGGVVHIVCRNQSKGEEAKQEITAKSENENIHLHILDMSKPRDVAQFARQFVESQKPLDVLVNNAGCMVNQREEQEDGLEKNFATNTLGTYILTTELIPALQRSSSPQVVTVSSGGMFTTKLDPHDLQFERVRNFDGVFAYAQNKRQQLVLNRLWAAKHPSIHFSCMHPGWADTPSVQTSMPSFYARFGDKLRSAEQGADTIVWLCVAERVRSIPSGLFFQDRMSVPEHLPLAWTRSSEEDEQLLVTKLEELKTRFMAQSE